MEGLFSLTSILTVKQWLRQAKGDEKGGEKNNRRRDIELETRACPRNGSCSRWEGGARDRFYPALTGSSQFAQAAGFAAVTQHACAERFLSLTPSFFLPQKS